MGLLASLADDTKIKFRLDWHPVKPGSFSIAGAGVRDLSDSKLYDEEGQRCGWIDYATGEGAVDVIVLRSRKELMMSYDYDPYRVKKPIVEINVERRP